MISKVQFLKSVIDSNPTVRLLQRKLNLEGLRYDKLSCSDDFDDVFDDERSLQQEKRIGSKNRPLDKKRYLNQYSKLSCEEDLDPGFAIRKRDQEVQTAEKAAQQVQRLKTAHRGETSQKPPPQQVKRSYQPVQQIKTLQNQGQQGKAKRYEEAENRHRRVCEQPSWQDDQKARQKFVQRRPAVCDNIERQLVNDNGISLRKLRKYMVVENVLQEVSLL